MSASQPPGAGSHQAKSRRTLKRPGQQRAGLQPALALSPVLSRPGGPGQPTYRDGKPTFEAPLGGPAQRRGQTTALPKLWQHLKSKQCHGLKFRRQHPIHHFILDFYCHGQQPVSEIDGDSHTDPAQQRYDQARTDWLNEQGLRVLRFTNRAVIDDLAGVLAEIGRGCGIA